MAMIATIVLAALLAFLPQGSFLMIIATVACFFCATVSLPLFNSMAFIYEKSRNLHCVGNRCLIYLLFCS
jgi:hypothetical protein